MTPPIKILVLEDSDLDKRILTLYLERSGLDYVLEMVDNEAGFVSALTVFKPDIVLADYLLPGFDGMKALTHHKTICPEVPFVFVTGQMSEETAIDCLKLGAWDYILKSRIKRLPVAIVNALKLRDEIRIKQEKENEIIKSELRFRSMAANISDGLLIVENGKVVYFNNQAVQLLRFENQNPENIKLDELIPVNVFSKIDEYFDSVESNDFFNIEFEKYYPAHNDYSLCVQYKMAVEGKKTDHCNCYITVSDVTKFRLQQREENLKLNFTRHLNEALTPEELFEITTAGLEAYLNIRNFAITILEPKPDMIRVVFIKDVMDTPKYFKAGNTFTARVIKNQELVFLRNEQIIEQVQSKQAEYVGERAQVWMGVPFITSEYKGAVVIQDYENENLISKNDIGLIRYIAEEVGKQLERKFAFEAIKTSELKFRELYENMSSGVAILEPLEDGSDFILRDLNKAAQSIFKGSEQGVNIALKSAFPEGKETGVFEALFEVFKTGESCIIPVKKYTVPGLSIWLDFYIYKLPSSELVIVFNDHSRSIRSEDLLRESERRYRTLSELTFEGILIHEGGVIVDCNLSFARLFGYQRDELIGKDYVELLLVPEAHQKIRDLINHGVTGIFEFTGIKKDSSLIPLEIEAKIITKNDKPLRVVAFRDITFRKKAIEEIRLSEEKLQKITQSAHDAIILMDDQGNISFWNYAAEQLFDLKNDEVLGKNLHQIIAPPKYWPLHLEGFKKFLVSGEGAAIGKTIELEAVKKGGEIITVELSLSSIMIKGKWNAVGILRDISERKRYESEIIDARQTAEEMNRLKTNFLATISHELRTPLNGILGFTELLLDCIEQQEYKHMLVTIQKSSYRLLNTFNLIIDLSVIEANKLKVRKKMENLVGLIVPIHDTYQAAASEKDLYLNLKTEVVDAMYETDSALLSQVINNLLDNALKYTETGGVTITLKKTNQKGNAGYAIQITDTGIGIPPQKITMIYEAFRQASEGYNRAYEGMGLGLHIAKRYVDELGGSIEVESEPDKGSQFTIFLPFISEPETNEQETPAPDQATIKNKEEKVAMPKVLYVEDDPDHREFVFIFLKKDYEVHLAEDGPTGIEMATNTHFDIILMDINLGHRMNGLEAVKEIRKIAGYENTPIAAVTANAMVTQKAEYLAGGCSDYISKPFNRKKLLEFMEKLVG